MAKLILFFWSFAWFSAGMVLQRIYDRGMTVENIRSLVDQGQVISFVICLVFGTAMWGLAKKFRVLA